MKIAVHYQPIIDLETSRVSGFEALMRFVEPDGSMVPPDERIDEVEHNEESYAKVMRQLVAQVARGMMPKLEPYPGIYVGINLPPSMIGNGVLKQLAEQEGLIAYSDRLVMEITERQALCDEGRQALAEARALGVRVAVDDFGTGESGLKQLLGLEFDILKIDKSQVDPILKDVTADRLIRGVIALASAMRVHVVAEGVETETQAVFLRAAGADYGQGWYWSKALPVDEVSGFLAERNG